MDSVCVLSKIWFLSLSANITYLLEAFTICLYVTLSSVDVRTSVFDINSAYSSKEESVCSKPKNDTELSDSQKLI